jgi:hypothetical protein
MNPRGEFQFYWTDSRFTRPAEGWEPISSSDFLEVEGRTESVAEPGDHSPPWAQDFC